MNNITIRELKFEDKEAFLPYFIMSKLEGINLETLWETMPHNNKMVILRELGKLIQEVHALPTAIGNNFLKNR